MSKSKGDKTNMKQFGLQRRHMATLTVICQQIEEERDRLNRLGKSNPDSWLLATQPTAGVLFSSSEAGDNGLLNQFIRQHGKFDAEIGSSNQLHRVIRFLRETGVLEDPQANEHIGNPHVYVPSPLGWRIYNTLQKEYSSPLYWPESILITASGSILRRPQSAFAPAFS